VFYTTRNAAYLDTARQLIGGLDPALRCFFLAPLLSEASIHANTSGVFKGFHKNRATGLGEFGGRKGDALGRILGDIKLPFPIFSAFGCDARVHRSEADALVGTIDEVDVAYLDPPYNQHPYGSNYFMLNLITDYEKPGRISRVSGIPDNWYRSDFNRPARAREALRDLAAKVKARFLLLSFNSEGFVGHEEMTALLSRLGRLEVLERPYNAFRGSRNLAGRGVHVREYLYLVERK
jgi:adenine-specific DNA-methyltransferase